MKTAEFNYWLLLFFANSKQNKKKLMMTMQYTNCVVKAHKVQTVKLTLYKYKSS